jgi:exonuclease VII small subunit
MEARMAIWDAIEDLHTQWISADGVEADEIKKNIDTLLSLLDELRRQSLKELDESEEVANTIAELRKIARDIDDEADTIESVTDALEKGAKLAAAAEKIIKGILKLLA